MIASINANTTTLSTLLTLIIKHLIFSCHFESLESLLFELHSNSVGHEPKPGGLPHLPVQNIHDESNRSIFQNPIHHRFFLRWTYPFPPQTSHKVAQ